jgi:hypothetical protein
LKLRPARSDGLDIIGGGPDMQDITAKPCCGKPESASGADTLKGPIFPALVSSEVNTGSREESGSKQEAGAGLLVLSKPE